MNQPCPTFPYIQPVATNRAPRPLRREITAKHRAEDDRQSRRSRSRRCKAWMPTAAGMTGVDAGPLNAAGRRESAPPPEPRPPRRNTPCAVRKPAPRHSRHAAPTSPPYPSGSPTPIRSSACARRTPCAVRPSRPPPFGRTGRASLHNRTAKPGRPRAHTTYQSPSSGIRWLSHENRGTILDIAPHHPRSYAVPNSPPPAPRGAHTGQASQENRK